MRDHGQSLDVSEVGVVRDDELLVEQPVSGDDRVGAVKLRERVGPCVLSVQRPRLPGDRRREVDGQPTPLEPLVQPPELVPDRVGGDVPDPGVGLSEDDSRNPRGDSLGVEFFGLAASRLVAVDERAEILRVEDHSRDPCPGGVAPTLPSVVSATLNAGSMATASSAKSVSE